MVRILEGYLIASLLLAKRNYLSEEYISVDELNKYRSLMYDKASSFGIDILFVVDEDQQKYFDYNIGIYTLKEGLNLERVLGGKYEAYLPLEVLKLLYEDNIVKEMLIEVINESIKEEEKHLERKKLLIKKLELETLNKGNLKR